MSNKGPAGRPGGPSVYNEKGRSFHPKAYIFRRKDLGEIYIGSSNVSRSALTSGIEWNYHFDDRRDSRNFISFAAL